MGGGGSDRWKGLPCSPPPAPSRTSAATAPRSRFLTSITHHRPPCAFRPPHPAPTGEATTVEVACDGLDKPGTATYARYQGGHVEVMYSEQEAPGHGFFDLEPADSPGLVQLEAAAGTVLGKAASVLVVTSGDVAEEVNGLADAPVET